MNFLVLFSLIATAMAASIPVESHSTNQVPLLSQRFPVAADGRQYQDFEWFNVAMGQLTALPLTMASDALEITLKMLECVFTPKSCSFTDASLAYLSALANTLASNDLKNKSATRDPNQKNYYGGSFMGDAVTSNNQRNPFPVAVPAYWSPYVNIPLVAGQNEGPSMNRPYVGSFMPYNNVYPSFMNTATQQAKGVVPASTVLDTTTY